MHGYIPYCWPYQKDGTQEIHYLIPLIGSMLAVLKQVFSAILNSIVNYFFHSKNHFSTFLHKNHFSTFLQPPKFICWWLMKLAVLAILGYLAVSLIIFF